MVCLIWGDCLVKFKLICSFELGGVSEETTACVVCVCVTECVLVACAIFSLQILVTLYIIDDLITFIIISYGGAVGF